MARPQSRKFPLATKFIIALVWPLLMLFTKRDRRGEENLPKEGAFVIAVNHLSYIDPFVMAHWMVDNRIPPRYLVKDTIFSIPVVGWLFKHVGHIPVYRGTKDASKSLDAAIAQLKAGAVIYIYPEGTMTRDPEAWPMSGRTGAVRLAHEAGVPIIPVAQWGAQEILWPYRKGLHLLPRKTMHVNVGTPLDMSDLGENPSEEEYKVVTERLMDRITDLQAEIRGERPTRPRIDVHTLNKPKTHHESEEN